MVDENSTYFETLHLMLMATLILDVCAVGWHHRQQHHLGRCSHLVGQVSFSAVPSLITMFFVSMVRCPKGDAGRSVRTTYDVMLCYVGEVSSSRTTTITMCSMITTK